MDILQNKTTKENVRVVKIFREHYVLYLTFAILDYSGSEK